MQLENVFAKCWPFCSGLNVLTHWDQVTHICSSKLTTIGSDNDLSPGQHQAIIWTNDGILLIPTLATNLSEILCEIHAFSFKKMRLKASSAKWRPFCLSLNVLKIEITPLGRHQFSNPTGPTQQCPNSICLCTGEWSLISWANLHNILQFS